MPIVPVIDSPTVSPQNGGFQPYAAPAVEPVKNFAPEQGAKMGAAVQGAGQQMIKVGEMIQDQIDDANTKAAVSWYTSQATKIMYDKETGYLNTLGLKAKDKYGETVEAFNKIESDATLTLTNPVQKKMFSAVVSKHKETFAAQMDTHAVKQIRVYGVGEAKAMQEQYENLAIISPNNRDFNIEMAVGQAKSQADLLQLPTDSAQRKDMVNAVYNKVSVGIANDLITKEDYAGAKVYLESQYEKQKIEPKEYQSLMRTVNVGYEKKTAIDFADKIVDSGALPPKNYNKESIIDYVIKRHEGAKDEAVKLPTEKGYTKFGIYGVENGLSDDQVKKLTIDDAKKIYSKKYWDNVGIDKLDPSVRLMAFDTAVNMGPDVAKKFAKIAGDDLDKWAQLRKERYAAIAEKDPNKKIFSKQWDKRVDTILNVSRGGSESLEDQLARTDGIENKDIRDMARTRIINRNREIDSVKKQDYQDTYDKAIEISSASPDAWTKVPPEIMSKLKEGDRQKLRNAADRQSDQNTLLYVQTHPESWAPDKLAQYRWNLSETDYRSFLAKGTAPNYGEKVLEVGYDQDQLKQKLLDFGLEKLVHPKKDSADEKERIRLNSQLEQNIDLAQKTAGRKLGLEEKNKIIDSMLRPVKVRAVEGWYFKSDTTMDKAPYQVKSKLNIIIPPEERKRIEQKLKDAGVRYNEETIIDSYLIDR